MHDQALRIRLITFGVVLIALFLTACKSDLPDPNSKEYRETVSAFYVGLAGLQTGEDTRAREKLTLTTKLAPGEPAGWANLGLLSMRQQELDAAYELIEKARQLAPDNSGIEGLLGLLETKRGKQTEALAHLRKAVELDPKNLRAVYALAQEIERQGGEENEAEALRLVERIVEVQPDNIAAMMEVTRLAAKRGEGEKVKRAVERIAPHAAAWPAEVRPAFEALQSAATSPNPRQAATQVAFLRNALARVPEYRQAIDQIRTPAEFIGEPFTKFLKLQSPSNAPAPADTAMTFSDAQPIPGVPQDRNWVRSIALDAEGGVATVVAGGGPVRVKDGVELQYACPPGKDVVCSTMPDGVLPVDLNYDFKTDFVLAGEGLRFYQQANSGSFTDVTSRTGLPANVLNDSYRGAWAFDVDLDGDLDVVCGHFNSVPIVLRNNGDGTFKELRPFDGVTSLMSFVAADLDGDGDPDPVLLDVDGKLHAFDNQRLGQYQHRDLPDLGKVLAINVADLNGDGLLDLVVYMADGSVIRLSSKEEGKSWEKVELMKWKSSSTSEPVPPGLYRIFLADLDNNGSLDIVLSNSPGWAVWLSDEHGSYKLIKESAKGVIQSVADVTGDGRLDLLGSEDYPAYKLLLFENHGTKNYHYQTIRTRAAKATGDQRINSFGIGGEMEIRAGLLTQKQVITSPTTHFGLGEQTQTDVARIVWPNGSVQAEFELKSDQAVLAEQRLKGSCPMLFAWDGKQMSFVKDAPPWSPALGLHINAQTVAQVQQTEEWFKIPGNKLAPHDGYYDLRITAELWETYYLDHYSLLVVDHPANTEIYTDERFSIPEPPLKVFAMNKPVPLPEVKDDQGQDVTSIVRELDGQYLDTFGRGPYQGVTRDHWVEMLLPEAASQNGQQWLIAHGWMHPTDGSINVAIGQGGYTPPRGLSLEVQNEKGNWIVAKPSLGFPAGKNKTILIDLTGLFKTNGAHRIRLRTNMEIYWDKLEYGVGLTEGTYQAQRIELSGADLLYRGFSEVSAVNDSSPEIYDYNHLRGTAPRWRDLIGYYTRHGDVKELLTKFDDRFVIVNAGDEVRLRFPEVAPPRAGWVRDYVIIGNGWIKDGDLNSTFSKTVLPLPSRATKDYNTPPHNLEDDPVYQRHKEDWQTYHTRYVTPDRFVKALRMQSQ